MASSLSEEEFERLQKQLIDLRTSNYQFDETCRKQQNELYLVKERCEILERDLQKCNKLLSKSKKAKEFEQLMEENELLQNKLLSQEDDFRLQTTTIMQELSNIVALNEQLEKENVELKTADCKVNDSEVQSEFRRIQAQNLALQKNLSDCQNNFENEIIGLKEKITKLTELNNELELRCMKLAGQRGTPAGGDDEVSLNQRMVEGESNHEVHFEDPLGCYNSPKERSNFTMIELMKQSDCRIEKLELQLKELNSVKLQLDTEKAENTILKEQLITQQQSHNQSAASLQEEISKLTEKLKKKQEILLELQDEKESIYSECQTAYEGLQRKEVEVETLSEQVSRLDSELTACKQNLDECLEQSAQKIQDMESELAALQEQALSQPDNQLKLLTQENALLSDQLNKSKQTLQNSFSEQESLKNEIDALIENCTVLSNKIEEITLKNEQLTKNLEEARKLADKRKSLLDDMDVHLQKTVNQHLDETASLRSEFTDKIDHLQGQLAIEKENNSDLEQCREKLKEVETQLQSSEGVKGWLERRLTESESELQKVKDDFEITLQTYQEEHLENQLALEKQHQEHLAIKQAELAELHHSSEQLLQSIAKLKQEAKDGIEDRKIHEKKSLAMLKDMKHQLQAERRRAEKLQEKLDEFLTEHNRSKQSVEDLFRPIDPAERQRGDNSSMSSYSGIGSKDTNHQSPSNTPPLVLEQENNDLLARIAIIQEEKWILEEKVLHLETSNAAMAEDLMSKAAVIEHYCMEKRSDHHHPSVHNPEKLTLKRVVDFVKDRGDENLKEINRKLQRMLEETLIKNMHLQKDLEKMAEQIGKSSINIIAS